MPAARRFIDPLIACSLFLGTIVVYWPVRHLEFVGFDDPQYVTNNAHVQQGLTAANLRWAFTTFTFANWHPLTWLSYLLDQRLFSLRPGPMHLENAVLHALSAAGWFLVLMRMTGGGCRWRCAAVAALFAVHLIHVESVAWISERKDVLSMLLAVPTLWFYVGYTTATQRRWRWGQFGTCGICLALGLMAKPMLVTLPLVMLLLDFWPLRRTSQWRLLIEKTPLLIIALGSCAITIVAQRGEHATATLGAMSSTARLANAAVSYGRYLLKAVYPVNFAVFYPLPQPGWPAAVVLMSLAVIIAITAIAIRQRSRRPWLLVGWFWFLISFLPVIGLVQVGSQAMADRYAYLPFIGLYIAIVWTVGDMLAPRRSAQFIVLGVVVAVLIPLTRRQIGFWQNSVTLFEHALEVEPENWMAHLQVGDAYADRDRTLAAGHYMESIRLAPAQPGPHINLAKLLIDGGDPRDALPHLEAALGTDPSDAVAHYNYGVALGAVGRPNEAAEQYRLAIKFASSDSDVSRLAVEQLKSNPH
jgi:tetratricopeptide (TPR) repeat protein